VLGENRKKLASRGGERSTAHRKLLDDAVRAKPTNRAGKEPGSDGGPRRRIWASQVWHRSGQNRRLSSDRFIKGTMSSGVEKRRRIRGQHRALSANTHHARIALDLRKGRWRARSGPENVIAAPAERAMPGALVLRARRVGRESHARKPTKRCGYRYAWRRVSRRFFRGCSGVLKAEPASRASRIALCQVTAAHAGDGPHSARDSGAGADVAVRSRAARRKDSAARARAPRRSAGRSRVRGWHHLGPLFFVFAR